MLLLVGPCSTGPPEPGYRVTERQLRTIQQTQQALHEQVAATRSPDGLYLTAFVVGLTVPIALAAALLVGAWRTRITADETIHRLVQMRLDGALTRAYVAQLPKPDPRPQLPSNDAPRRQLPGRRNRRRRRGRNRRSRKVKGSKNNDLR